MFQFFFAGVGTYRSKIELCSTKITSGANPSTVAV
jgi:hypothetical protein